MGTLNVIAAIGMVVIVGGFVLLMVRASRRDKADRARREAQHQARMADLDAERLRYEESRRRYFDEPEPPRDIPADDEPAPQPTTPPTQPEPQQGFGGTLAMYLGAAVRSIMDLIRRVLRYVGNWALWVLGLWTIVRSAQTVHVLYLWFSKEEGDVTQKLSESYWNAMFLLLWWFLLWAVVRQVKEWHHKTGMVIFFLGLMKRVLRRFGAWITIVFLNWALIDTFWVLRDAWFKALDQDDRGVRLLESVGKATFWWFMFAVVLALVIHFREMRLPAKKKPTTPAQPPATRTPPARVTDRGFHHPRHQAALDARRHPAGGHDDGHDVN